MACGQQGGRRDPYLCTLATPDTDVRGPKRRLVYAVRVDRYVCMHVHTLDIYSVRPTAEHACVHRYLYLNM